MTDEDLIPSRLLRLERLAGPHGFGVAKEWCRRYRAAHKCTVTESLNEACEILASGKPLPNVPVVA